MKSWKYNNKHEKYENSYWDDTAWTCFDVSLGLTNLGGQLADDTIIIQQYKPNNFVHKFIILPLLFCSKQYVSF